jgi:tol-pal system protein YbgF
MRIKLIIAVMCLAMFFMMPVSLLADEAPVVDLSQNAAVNPTPQSQEVTPSTQQQVPLAQTATSPATQTQQQPTAFSNSEQTQSMSITERLARLEQQVGYLQQMNLAANITKLQQSIADLQGLIDIQGHKLKQLEDQQRQLYADLDKRIAAISGKPASTSAPTPTPTTSAATPTNQTDNTSANTANNNAASGKEMQMYNSAIEMITNKQYSAATAALQNYLRQYPTGRYVANAHYWLGELYSIAGDDNKAANEFNTVVQNYATSSKAADSLLKLASMAFNKAQFDQAKQYWQTLIQQYPNSSAARIASTHLKKLQNSQ